MHDRQASEETVVVEDVDGVPVGELRHEQVGEARERRFVVERRGERLARLGQHGQPGACVLGGSPGVLPFGDVGDHDADADRVVVDVEDRVVADEPVTRLARLAGRRTLEVEVEDRLARLEDLAMEGLDLVCERVTEHVSKASAEVFFGGYPVQGRERVVYPDIAKGGIHECESDGSCSKDRIEDGK